LIFITLQSIITYILTESSKCNDEDTGNLERFTEREGKAETFLALETSLPPLNTSFERHPASIGWRQQPLSQPEPFFALLLKMENWVEPRVCKLVPVSGAGFFIFSRMDHTLS